MVRQIHVSCIKLNKKYNQRMSKERLAAIAVAPFLTFAGIFGAAITGKKFLFKKNELSDPVARSFNPQIFFSSLGIMILGIFMLAFGIWGE